MSTQLKKGDIIVFKATDDWISKCIALFTDSDVSHASMLYSEDTIVEMYYQKIGVNKITEKPDDAESNGVESNAAKSSGLWKYITRLKQCICICNRKPPKYIEAHIMRLKPERDPEPLIKAADKYINGNTKYNFPGIIMLAGLIIYREIRPTPKFIKVADLILRMACAALDRLIQKVQEDKSMVCSQLVYQVHRDCGKDYMIQGNFQLRSEPGKSKSSESKSDTILIIDKIADRLKKDSKTSSADSIKINQDEKDQDEEEVAQDLYSVMEKSKKTDTIELDPQNDVFKNAVRFIQRLEQLEDFLKEHNPELPIYSLFVTPGDLVYRSTNLKQVGIAKFHVQR